MAEFLHAYKRTAQYEGGYANVEDDKGGETYAGISRKYYPNWEGWKIVDANKPLKRGEFIKSVYLDSLIRLFYKREKWDTIKGDYIDDQLLADFLYDYNAHSGTRSIEKLQHILHITEDGIFGSQTLAAVNAADAAKVFTALKNERKSFLMHLASQRGQEKFRAGWLDRINRFL